MKAVPRLTPQELIGRSERRNTTLLFESECSLALTAAPLRCPVCGRLSSCFVNRDGRTRCFACDGEYAARGLRRLQTSVKGSG